MLNKILRFFVKGIKNVEIKRKTNCEMITTNKSFKMIYQTTEKIRRNNVQLQKQYEKKFRKYKLKFLKNFVLKNLSKQKIDVMFTFFHINKIKIFQRLKFF